MKQQVRFAVFLPSRSTSSRPLHHDVTAVFLRTVHDKRANLYIFTGRVTCHSRTPLRLQWVASGKLLDKYCYCNPVVQTMWYSCTGFTCDRKSPHFVACCASHSQPLLSAVACACVVMRWGGSKKLPQSNCFAESKRWCWLQMSNSSYWANACSGAMGRNETSLMNSVYTISSVIVRNTVRFL